LTDLRTFAERYCRLEIEIEQVRNAMRQALANGSDLSPANPTWTAGKPSGSRAETLAAAQAPDERVLALIIDRPMKAAEIARATGAKANTTGERMNRLKAKGAVQRDEAGAWSLSSTLS
jgi:hypothetical protein